MSTILLPDVLESTLSDLLVKQKLSSWNVHGGVKCTTVTLRFHSEHGSHVVPTSGYRRKSPCELRRDEQRAKARRLERQAQELPVTGNDRPTASTPTVLTAQLGVSSANQLTEVNNYFENIDSDQEESCDEDIQQDNDNKTTDSVSLEACMELLSSMHEDMKDISATAQSCSKIMKSTVNDDYEGLDLGKNMTQEAIGGNDSSADHAEEHDMHTE